MNAYIRLSRLHRPQAIFLFMFPCWWGVALASAFATPYTLNVKLLLLFVIGSIVIRGAGCTFNDLIDRDIDSQVVRTKGRPIASGEITPTQAIIFFSLQCLGGLAVLFFLPFRCWPLSLLGFALLALYPFMKRITHWPQLFLGLAINLGIIFGAVAVTPYEVLNWPAVFCLYGIGVAWTLGYDTIYALQDKEDDLKIGVKSTAIHFGKHVKAALFLSYGTLFALLAFIGYWTKGDFVYYGLVCLGAAATALMLIRLNTNNPAACLKAFNANPYLGFYIWGTLLTL
ncbi:MAG: 4-hydroxybenzoate octaprenyltransferase [Alphaproteobacteria bacterium]|nr:4-hydroxybenzoate octaprenyltransferase [Alphaproteobacteria bacterium]